MTEALRNWSTHTPHTRHRLRVQTCSRHTCTHVRVRTCTHTYNTHTLGHWKTLLSLGHHDVNRARMKRSSLPGRGLSSAHLVCDANSGLVHNTARHPGPNFCRVLPSGGADRIGPEWQTEAKAWGLLSISGCVTFSLESIVTHP